MGVVEDQFLEAAGGDACAQVADNGQKGLRAYRKGAGKSNMLVALAVADGRQGVDGHLGRKQRKRLAEQKIVDQRVRGQGR